MVETSGLIFTISELADEFGVTAKKGEPNS